MQQGGSDSVLYVNILACMRVTIALAYQMFRSCCLHARDLGILNIPLCDAFLVSCFVANCKCLMWFGCKLFISAVFSVEESSSLRTSSDV